MTQRVAALFDSLEQHIQRERQQIASLRQRLAGLENENQQLRHSLAERAEPPERTVNTQSPVPATHAERGYPLPRRAASRPPADVSSETAEPGPGEVPSPQALLDEWYRRYTATFFKGHTRPLKVGIHEDLAANEPWPDKLVRRALACYVNLPRYLKAVRAGAGRVDLGGESAGVVTPGEARHAHTKLEALQAQQRKRDKTEQRDARHNQSARIDRKLGDLLAKHGKH